MTSSGDRKDLVLKVVQQSLVGLMDGSVSTLAPLFATAFADREYRVAACWPSLPRSAIRDGKRPTATGESLA